MATTTELSNIRDFNSSYQIDSTGIITYKGKRVYLQVRPDGYVIFKKRSHPKRINYYVHILVAEAFLENPLNLPCINHKNGIKSDNRVENLEWCTYKDNTKHAVETGLWNQDGENNMLAKFTNQQAEEIRKLKNKLSYSAIAQKYGVKYMVIYSLLNNKTYKL